MKNLLLKAFLVLAMFYNTRVSGQIFATNDLTLGPGLGCNAAKTSTANQTIQLPFPHGITFAELTHLSTKYFTTSNIQISISVWVHLYPDGGGWVNISFYPDASSLNTWQETGNLIYPNTNIWAYSSGVTAFDPYSYEDILYYLGDRVIYNVTLNVGQVNNGILSLDDTKINNLLITYDDCNNNGVFDYYECNASTPQADKRYVCHNGNTICVNSSAVNAHLAHGDYLGPCQVNQTQSVTQATQLKELFIKPKEVRISNFPNPVVSSMKISYELPTDSRINIVLIDASGKAIPIIANDQKKAGIYDHLFDASKLPSGLYYCRISATNGDKTTVKGQKVIVIK